jgi:putative membrane protein insertion efficiency factor
MQSGTGQQPDPAMSDKVSAQGSGQSASARIARFIIRIYQLTLSAFFGRTCRHLPTCSDFADQAIATFGLWAGGWMALGRIWRCRPLGSHGYDPIPDTLPADGRWYTPWRYARWRSSF